MAKQLKWGNFGIEDLRVDEEDDIYKGFPFLKLEGFEMILKTLLTITVNLVRGMKGTDDAKITGLAGSLPCLLYTSPSPRDRTRSRMPSSA